MGELAVSKRREETHNAAKVRCEKQSHGLSLAQSQKREAGDSNGEQQAQERNNPSAPRLIAGSALALSQANPADPAIMPNPPAVPNSTGALMIG